MLVGHRSVYGREWRGKRTDADDIELEAALEQLALNLGGDAVETDVGLGVDGGRAHGRHDCELVGGYLFQKAGDGGKRIGRNNEREANGDEDGCCRAVEGRAWVGLETGMDNGEEEEKWCERVVVK